MNYIFDFDGTICDSFDLTLRVANEYLTKFKKQSIDPKKFRENGIEEIIKNYKLNKLQILLYVIKGRRELGKHISELKTFPSIAKVINELSVTNCLGIVSSNSKRNIDLFLKINNMENCFKFIISSPTIFDKAKKIRHAIKKYLLDKNETLYIGDEIRDINAAKKSGLKSVAVTWGFENKRLLESHKPDFLLNKPLELLKI